MHLWDRVNSNRGKVLRVPVDRVDLLVPTSLLDPVVPVDLWIHTLTVVTEPSDPSPTWFYGHLTKPLSTMLKCLLQLVLSPKVLVRILTRVKWELVVYFLEP